MTTWKVHEDQDLADALTLAIEKASPDAVVALSELRSCATAGNGYHLAHVPWEAREPVARALRATSTDHPLSDQLVNLADGLEQSLAWRMAHHPDYTGRAPRPAPQSEPAAEVPAEPEAAPAASF